MQDKIGKYGGYLLSFTKSSNKLRLIKQLLKEIKLRGPVTGIQSLLHIKVYEKEVRDSKLETDIEFTGTEHLSLQEYDQNSKISLPIVTAPRISIIISAGDNRSTDNCIRSILTHATANDQEIIIADSVAGMSSIKSRNKAAANARGELLVFLDGRIQVQQEWLEELAFIFEHNKYAGLAGSKLLNADGRLTEAGCIVWRDTSITQYGNGDNPNLAEYNYVKEVDMVSGASMMIRKRLWEEMGGYDEGYSETGYEDADLCFRVRNKGYKVMYQPFSVVVRTENAEEKWGEEADNDPERFYEKWQHMLKAKAWPEEHLFYERDRTTGEKHILLVAPYSPAIDEFIGLLIDMNYSVKFIDENGGYAADHKKLQQKEVEVLNGNELFIAKQGWRHFVNTNLMLLDAVLMGRTPVSTQVAAYLESRYYFGNRIFMEPRMGCITAEKGKNIKGQMVYETKMIQIDMPTGNLDRKKMAEALISII